MNIANVRLRTKRDQLLKAMDRDELLAYTLRLDRHFQEGSAYLRCARNSLSWLQSRDYVRDIDNFFDRVKAEVQS
jgi:hypothetical protein